MTVTHEIVLRCIELAIPQNTSNPDVQKVLDRAAAYVRFVEDNGSAALERTNADTGANVKAASPDTSKEPGKPGRKKQSA